MGADNWWKTSLILGCCVVGAAVGLSLHALTLYELPLEVKPRVEHFEISRGESRDSVVARLAGSGLFPQSWLLNFVVRYREHGGCFKAGVHEIHLPESPENILAGLCAAPRAPGYRFTIREGVTLWKVEQELVKAGLALEGDLVGLSGEPQNEAAARLPSARHLPSGTFPNRMEGYLFPDTYHLPLEDSVDALVRRATQRAAVVLEELLSEKEPGSPLTNTHELVTLASIVQREAVLVDEMPTIASVYLNRLRTDMKLQADPTIIYSPTAWQQAASPVHRKNRKNPYNTYAHHGLPPGPIGAVGRDALQAVLNPAETDYLFFVARGDGSGSHAFAKTFEAHRKNVAEYRKARRAQNSSR